MSKIYENRLDRIKSKLAECDDLHPSIEHYRADELETFYKQGDIHYLIEQAEEAIKYKRMYLDADKKQSEYWQYKISFEKLVEVLNK